MSTGQLIVLWYCGLAIFAVLLLSAVTRDAPSYLIVAILVIAALLIYFLKPHPLARKRRVLMAVFGPIVALALSAAGGWIALERYQQRQAAEMLVSGVTTENLPKGLTKDMLRGWLEDNHGATAQDGIRQYLTLRAQKTGRSLDEVIKDSFRIPENLPDGLTPEKIQRFLSNPENVGATVEDAVREYVRLHQYRPMPTGDAKAVMDAWVADTMRRNPGLSREAAVNECFVALSEQDKKEEADRQAADTAKQKAAMENRLKTGDRVSAINDGRIALYSGVYSEKKPRLYGTVMDVEFDPQNRRSERYAIKWDGGNLVWIDGRHDLQRIGGAKKAPTP